jgi:Family of unknown function (DUF6058)
MVPIARSEKDIAYVQQDFVPLQALLIQRRLTAEQLARWQADGLFPRPTYLLQDGTGYYPKDVFTLLDDAQQVELVPAHFRQRFEATPGHTHFSAHTEWTAYLTGRYGACLKSAIPENIVHKELLVKHIQTLLQEAQPLRQSWKDALFAAIGQLDTLERPFADCDRELYGGTVSRDRYITIPLQQFF